MDGGGQALGKLRVSLGFKGPVHSRSRVSKCLSYVLSALFWELSIVTREISNMGPEEGKKRVKERRQREEKGTLLSCCFMLGALDQLFS